MKKLVFKYFWGDIGCSGTSFIPFEYEGKEEFLFDTFEKYKNHDWEDSRAELFNDIFIDEHDFESLENYIYTLDEWFELEKIKIYNTKPTQ